MYIEPNTNIRILANVPLENTYEHTVLQSSKEVQAANFIDYQKYNLSDYTYQRVNNQAIRVSIKADDLYNCNYLMFQNTNYGTKWFYAFITGIEYVNNETSTIRYEIDIMQTWYFDYELEMSYVEREHTEFDEVFGNLVPENLNIGEDYVVNDEFNDNYGDMSICLMTSENSSGTINNLYVPLNVVSGVPVSDPATIDALIKNYVDEGQEDKIVHIYQYPSWLGSSGSPGVKEKNLHINFNHRDINGYIPKNNKLFSYPYIKLLVSNENGQISEYKWELWGDIVNAGKFTINGTFIGNPALLCYPTNYKGRTKDYDSGITLSNFPQTPWVGDTYKAWLAQNKGTIASSMLSSTFATALTLLAGAVNPGLGIATSTLAGGLLSNAVSLIGQASDKQATPPQVHGQLECDALNVALKRYGFTFQSVSIRKEIAKVIDDFFSVFGYAVRQLKIPNRSARPHWNYTKTINCCARGSLPADDLQRIIKIYNTGITFWHNMSEIGNYELDNSPIGEG